MKKDFAYGVVVFRSCVEGVPSTLDDYQVLMVKHQGSMHWSFPKGHKEGQESDREAALREVSEETGFLLHPSFLLDDLVVEECYVTDTSHHSDREPVDKTVTFYVAVIDGENFLDEDDESLSPQSGEIAYVRRLEGYAVRDLLTYESTKVMFDDVVTGLVSQGYVEEL